MGKERGLMTEREVGEVLEEIEEHISYVSQYRKETDNVELTPAGKQKRLSLVSPEWQAFVDDSPTCIQYQALDPRGAVEDGTDNASTQRVRRESRGSIWLLLDQSKERLDNLKVKAVEEASEEEDADAWSLLDQSKERLNNLKVKAVEGASEE